MHVVLIPYVNTYLRYNANEKRNTNSTDKKVNTYIFPKSLQAIKESSFSLFAS